MMKTDQATVKLAQIYGTGDADSKEERAAEGHLWEAIGYTQACDWAKAEYQFEAAYHALGAVPPEASAGSWERGKHAIQIEAERQFQESECDASAWEGWEDIVAGPQHGEV
jgi:hypothetical protein